MKKIVLLGSILSATLLYSQFKVSAEIPSYLSDSEAYLYGFNGSKEVLLSKGKFSKNKAEFSVDKKYVGMMRGFFTKVNSSVNMVSENQSVDLKIELDSKNKISNVVFQDPTNQLFSNEIDVQKKKELILPALIQIKDYYRPDQAFYRSLESEISNLSKDEASIENHPFLSFYQNNQKFNSQEKLITLKSEDFVNFFTKSNEYLETSSMMKPALINYLNLSKSNVEGAVDKLLESVNVETPRGQTVLSELIDIFNTYNMEKLKNKYLAEGNNLKCTINERLSETLASNNNTELGAKFPNSKFVNPINTTAKSLYDIKSSKKIVVFWSSTCSHCEEELPQILKKYEDIKAQKIQVIGFSLDSNLNDFKNKASQFPWISDSEGKGWYSSYGTTYNIVATPTYFVLDADNKIVAKPNHVGDLLEYLKLK